MKDESKDKNSKKDSMSAPPAIVATTGSSTVAKTNIPIKLDEKVDFNSFENLVRVFEVYIV